jgi:Flp pilus assembly protein TadD
MTANHQPLMKAGMDALLAGDIEGSLRAFAEARRLMPTDIGLLHSLALLYLNDQRFPEAWSAAETGLALHPGNPDFIAKRIAAMSGAGFTDAALTLARAQMAVAPDNPLLVEHFGTLLLRVGDAPTALQVGKAALARHPDFTGLLSMTAEAAFRLGDTASARRWLDHALSLEPGNGTLRMARATMLLSIAQWDQGLKDYEVRLQTRKILRQDLSIPRWQGEDIAGKHLLVVSEQGVGDQMRFLRDILAVLPFCGRVTVECAARLVPLFRRSLPEAVQVLAAQERSEGRRHVFDYGWLPASGGPQTWIEMGSLMLRLLERGRPPEGLAG